MTDSRSWFYLACLLVLGWLLWLLGPVLTPFLVAAAIAYLTDPLLDRLERSSIRGRLLGRTPAVLLVFLLLTCLFVLVIVVLVPVSIRQFHALVSNFPAWVDWFMGTAVPWLGSTLALPELDMDKAAVQQLLKDYWKEFSRAALELLQSVGRGGTALAGIVAGLVLVPVVAFYLMRDWDRLLNGIHDLLPRHLEGEITRLAREIDEVLAAFLRGQLLVMVGLGLVYSSGLMLIGLNGAFLIGFVAGLLSVVPYLGSIVGLAIAVGVALFQFGDLLHFLLVLLVFGAGQALEGMVLTPWLVGDRIGLHPVAVIFAVLAGGQLFGFLGILLALPVAAALMVLVRHAHELYRQSPLYNRDND